MAQRPRFVQRQANREHLAQQVVSFGLLSHGNLENLRLDQPRFMSPAALNANFFVPRPSQVYVHQIMPIPLAIMNNNMIHGPNRAVLPYPPKRRGTGAYIPHASREYCKNYVNSMKSNRKQEANTSEASNASGSQNESFDDLSLPKEWTYEVSLN